MRRLSAFAFEAITLWNFEKKMNEANASVKRNMKKKTCKKNARLKMKQQRRRAARAECVIRKCYFELACMEQSQAGINAHNLL